METAPSLGHSMDKAKKHYSSLFFLPSYKKALISITAICVAGVSLTATAFLPAITSLLLGISVFAATIIADLIISKALLQDDPIFTPRRTSAMSFYCWLLWLGFLALGVALGFIFGWLLWVKLTLLGFAAVLTLRVIVLSSTSNSAKWRQVLSASLQPILCITAFLAFWMSISNTLTLHVLPFIVLAPIISYTAVYLLLRSIDRLGKTTYLSLI